MKTCIQRGVTLVAANSSMVHTEPWLRQNPVPAAAAARAAARSPSGQNNPLSPVGPIITGRPSRRPKSSIARSRSAAPSSGRGTRSTEAKAASLRPMGSGEPTWPAAQRSVAGSILPSAEGAFLAARRIGYLATADGRAAPHVVPVCFAIVDDALYVAIDEKPKHEFGRPLKRLRNI